MVNVLQEIFREVIKLKKREIKEANKNCDWHMFQRTLHWNIQIVDVCILDKCTSVSIHDTVQIKLVSNTVYNTRFASNI